MIVTEGACAIIESHPFNCNNVAINIPAVVIEFPLKIKLFLPAQKNAWAVKSISENASLLITGSLNPFYSSILISYENLFKEVCVKLLPHGIYIVEASDDNIIHRSRVIKN